MAKFAGYLLLLLILLAAGAVGYLAVFDPPPPTIEVVRTLSDERFPR